MSEDEFADYLERKIKLKRVGGEEEAGLWVAALPWGDRRAKRLSLGGARTGQKELGEWPAKRQGRDVDGARGDKTGNEKHPRRLLLFGQPGGTDLEHRSGKTDIKTDLGNAPLELTLVKQPDQKAESAQKAEREKESAEGEIGEGKISMRLWEKAEGLYCYWERYFLVLGYGEKEIELAMGLVIEEEVHWWEACKLVEVGRGETFVEMEMGGVIPRKFPGAPGGESGAHQHNWLNGRVYVRLHSNGVIEVYAHHINSAFFDDGRDLKGVIPVLGFRVAGTQVEKEILGEWRGQHGIVTIGDARVDFREVARLGTDALPGRCWQEGEMLVLQPYAGVELFGGAYALQISGDPWIERPESGNFPQGMARTLRFSLSLSDASPVVVRYIAPAAWYEKCHEFGMGARESKTSDGSVESDKLVEEAYGWLVKGMVEGGFEDGAVPRYLHKNFWEGYGRMRYEAGWDGEVPFAQFLHAWKMEDSDAYLRAMRSAWYFSDVVVNHANKKVHMHGWPAPAFSLPMSRVQGTFFAYLETGVPYLQETAEAVITTAHWINKNSWPRMTVGRDACYIRSAVLLYRYGMGEEYRKFAEEGIEMVLKTQRENGSFGDQGGGSGVHQWAGYISKPWMGCLALGGVLDYLEWMQDSEKMKLAVKRFGDWLLAERWEHAGMITWSYQHDFADGRKYPLDRNGNVQQLPSMERWHQELLGRVLGYCSREFKNPEYYAAYQESFRNQLEVENSHELSSHAVSAVLEMLGEPLECRGELRSPKH